MRRSLRSPKRATRSERRSNRQGTLGRSAYHRRLTCEALEERQLLSIGCLPQLPGMHLVDPNPENLRGQIVYLDFDGAKGVDYNGPVTVKNIDVPTFIAPESSAGREQDVILAAISQLNSQFSDMGVVFTATPPSASSSYSTVYVGGGGDAFLQYGCYAGLAEATDIGNQDRADAAFVFSNHLAWAGFGIGDVADTLAGVISHEAGHLLGYEHQQPHEEGGVLAEVATSYYSPTGSSHVYSLTTAPATHTFNVDGIFAERWTEWYVNGAYTGEAQNDHSWLGNIYSDPSYTYTFSSGTTNIEANVYSVNADGSWHWLEYHRWNVSVNRVPSEPGTISAPNVTGTSAQISWGPASDPDGDSITYEVQYGKTYYWDGWTSAGTTSSTSKTITGLDPDYTYTVRVYARDGRGGENYRDASALFKTKNPRITGAWWENASGSTITEINEGQTARLVVSTLDFTSSDFFYADVVEGGFSSQGEQASNILLTYSSSSGNWVSTWTAKYIKDSYDYTEGNYDPEYYFELDTYGNTSGELKVRDKTPPAAPTFDSSSSSHQPNTWSKDHDPHICWLAPAAEVNYGGGIAGYYVLVNNSSNGTPSASDPWTTANDISLSNVADTSSLYVHVRAIDNAGNLATASDVAHLGPFKIDDTPPDKVSGLINPANPLHERSPNVTWSAPLDATSGIGKYEINFSDGYGYGYNDKTFWSTNTTLDDAEIDQSLEDAEWTWWVRAYDAAGNPGPWSDGKILTVDATQRLTVPDAGITKGLDRDADGYASTFTISWDTAVNFGSWTVFARVFCDDWTPTGSETQFEGGQSGNYTVTAGTTSTQSLTLEIVNDHVLTHEAADIRVRLYDASTGGVLIDGAYRDEADPDLNGVTLESGGDGTPLPAGTWTTIIHGLSSAAYSTLTTGTGWMLGMAEKLWVESRNVAVHTITGWGNSVSEIIGLGMTKTSIAGAWSAPSIALNDSNYHHVLLFDWAEVSNYSVLGTIEGIIQLWGTDRPPTGASGDDGYAEAAADVLCSLLRWLPGSEYALIGFSRGGVVASEVAQRILVDNDPATSLSQVIYLDAEGGGSSPEHSDPSFGLYSDDQYWAWNGVTSDNYYETFVELPPVYDFGGHQVDGARDYNDGALTYAHEDFLLIAGFYRYFIGGVIGAENDGLFVVDGSIVTKDTPESPSDTPKNPASTTYDPPAAMEIFNGGFEYTDSTAGWWYHGGGMESTNFGTVENGTLTLDRGESRTHNWTYVPSTARSIQFDLNIPTPSATANLNVYWLDQGGTSHLMDSIPITSGNSGTAKRVPLPANAWDAVGRVRFSLEGTGSGQVQLDNITFSSTTVDQSFAVAITPSSFLETAGTSAATGTVSRSGPLVSAVVVSLNSSDTGEATVPTTVTIPVGQAAATFAVAAVDDGIYDQTQSLTITASASGYNSGSTNIQVTDNELPGLSVSINPTTFVENAGSSAATGTVTRQGPTTSAVTVSLTSSNTGGGTVPTTVTIPVGQAFTTFAVAAVDDSIYDGTQNVTITASAAGFASGTASVQVTDNDPPGLAVAINPSTLVENAGSSAATGTITRQGPTTSALTVNLTSSDTTEATVPMTVTIPIGQASATFAVAAVDDAIYDQTGNVTITASATGFTSGTANIQVTDNDPPGLAVAINPTTFAENVGSSAATGTVTRQGPTTSALTVSLASSDTTEATVPTTVTIPVGQSSATFPVAAVDDAIYDETQNVSITAAASGFTSGTAGVQVTDNDPPGLAVTINASTFAENAGSTAATGTVTRQGPTTSALTVNLTSNDTTEATVPATVTIPVGQGSATFAVAAVDDTDTDGIQNVTITASATGYSNGTATAQVADNETPTLTLVVNPSGFAENAGSNAAMGTITRNTSTAAALTVNLTSSDITEATVPATVTIPAGQSSTTFAIAAVDDTPYDGTQSVTITASAATFISGTAGVQVTDNELPALTITINPSNFGENAGSSAATGTVTRQGPTTLAVIVNLTSSDITEATVPTTVTIPVGQSSATFAVAAVDDTDTDGSQNVTITASATGYSTGTTTAQVTDDETPTLKLVVTPSTFAENAGSSAATGTITRNTSTTVALTVNLTSSDTTEATVPTTVTIPAGQSSTTFAIAAVDDTIYDGTQSATITASTSGYVSGTAGVQVTDNDPRGLTVTINPDTVAENAGSSAATGTVTRQGPTTAAVTVNLTSSDTTEATVPATVTIPAGQASAPFAVAAIDDTLSDGTQNVTIAAAASGYNSGTAAVQVTDNDLPTVPYTQNFSAGKPGIGQGWEYYSTNQGRIQVVSGQLRMDDSKNDSTYSLNEAILHLNLANRVNVQLKLDHQSSNDSTHTYSGSQFTGHVNADMVAVSVNGKNWVKVTDLTSSFTGKTFALETVLQQAGQAAGSTDRSNVRIKFQQYDDEPWSSDGRAFDNIQVTGVVPGPEIDLLGNNVSIPDGDTTPGSADYTDFGSADVSGQTVTRTFTIKNTGTANLNLLGSPRVVVTGPNASDFAVKAQPASPVGVNGGTTTFQIVFDPSATGLRQATVSIASDDANEDPYDFAIRGTGVALVPQTPPYTQNFSAGKPGIGQGWEYYSTNQGRIQVVSGQLRLDDSKDDSVYSLNEAILHVNLANRTNVKLKFDHKNSNDSTHKYSQSQFTGHVNADMVAVSVNGNNWVKVTDLTSSFTGKTFALDTLLQQASQAAGSVDRSNVWIKFQQYDKKPWSSDGRALDNIQVTATQSASLEAVTSRSPSAQAGEVLTQADLRPLVQAAIAQWANTGLPRDQIQRLQQVHVVITDLPGSNLGRAASDTIYLDADAAGYTWFIDRSPRKSEEFLATSRGDQLYAVDARAVDRIDLLTVVSHELGHIAGLDDATVSGHDLMNGTLASGIRRSPGEAEIDALFTSRDWLA